MSSAKLLDESWWMGELELQLHMLDVAAAMLGEQDASHPERLDYLADQIVRHNKHVQRAWKAWNRARRVATPRVDSPSAPPVPRLELVTPRSE